MTAGETWESCLDEIRALPSVKKYGDDVKVPCMSTPVHPGQTGISNRVLFPNMGNPEGSQGYFCS